MFVQALHNSMTALNMASLHAEKSNVNCKTIVIGRDRNDPRLFGRYVQEDISIKFTRTDSSQDIEA